MRAAPPRIADGSRSRESLIIEAFLYRTFILDAAAKNLKQNVPAKLKRKKP
jgi:hypothetical protein